jgi:hypothetical protein
MIGIDCPNGKPHADSPHLASRRTGLARTAGVMELPKDDMFERDYQISLWLWNKNTSDY